MSVDTNQDTLQAVREEATDLGISFQDSWKEATIQKKIDEKLEEITKSQQDNKKKKEAKAQPKEKIKVIIEPRDGDDNIVDQFFSYSSMSTGESEDILVLFGEEVSISKRMYEHIKSISLKTKKFKMVTDSDGIPQKEWYTSKKSRFIVEVVD